MCHIFPTRIHVVLNLCLKKKLNSVLAWATWCVSEELVGHVSQRQDGDHTVVTVGFNEVMASDGCWINVVLPEWSNKCLQRDKEREKSGAEIVFCAFLHFLDLANLVCLWRSELLLHRNGFKWEEGFIHGEMLLCTLINQMTKTLFHCMSIGNNNNTAALS